MVDYSKWDNLSDSDEDEVKPKFGGLASGGRVPKVDSELTTKLRELKASDPKKLKQLQAELKAMKCKALQQKKTMLGKGGTENMQDNQSLDEIKAQLEDMKLENLMQKERVQGEGGSAEMLSKQSQILEKQLAEIDKKKKAMDANMENLERLAAAGDGESVLRFFESQGMSRDDIQRMMGGNDADTKEVLNSTASKAAEKLEDPQLGEAADRALKLADDMSVALSDENHGPSLPPHPMSLHSTVPPAPLKESIASSETKKEKSASRRIDSIVPTYSQRVITPKSGESKHVKIVVELPGLNGARDAELDIAVRTFKLKAPIHNEKDKGEEDDEEQHPLREFLLNLELVEPVDPERCEAKWSKKTQSLAVKIPVV